ncbi:hypothetical protein K474DRAFT_1701327 [Panus rudis PR-1116 ss-1]|nr:hypothetical protein K474DRAFT_1701327 [Panus rudis PR-1116 ss-1]
MTARTRTKAARKPSPDASDSELDAPSAPLKVRNGSRRKSTRAAATRTRRKLEEEDSDSDNAYEEDEDDEESLHSDALDEDDEDVQASRKRKRAPAASSSNSPAMKSRTSGSPTKKQKTTPKKRKSKKGAEADDDEFDLDLDEGQEIVGRVVQAPKTGRVPPGQISQNTFDFLAQLKKPECNDREWFKLHEPVYRLAEKEWKDFVEEFTNVLVEADPEIPPLPPKDVIHRIYRDVRFSNDKTPYKTGFSASFSRTGRKGVFAHYHIGIRPGGQSLIAAGAWQPGKDELNTIRDNILRNPKPLRRIISAPEFVELFGEAKPHPKGKRQNIFGGEDELKVAPKGVAKTHKDIDLLKCRSFAVIHHFTDAEVLHPEFKDELGKIVEVLRPFVHCLNALMIPNNAGSDSSDDGEGDEEDEEDESGED